MQKIIFNLFVVAIICLGGLTPLKAMAGAWTMPAGEGQIISTFDISQADSFFSDSSVSDVNFSKQEQRIYYEHGITDKITLVLNGAHQQLNFQSSESALNFTDFTDIELGASFQLHRDEQSALAFQGSYIIGGGPPRSIIDLDGPEDGAIIRALYGRNHSFSSKTSGFFDLQPALRFREGDGLIGWDSDVTFGVKHGDRFMVLAQVFHSDRRGEEALGFSVPSSSRTQGKFSLVYRYKGNNRVQLGYQRTVLGSNILRENTFSIGSWWRY